MEKLNDFFQNINAIFITYLSMIKKLKLNNTVGKFDTINLAEPEIMTCGLFIIESLYVCTLFYWLMPSLKVG